MHIPLRDGSALLLEGVGARQEDALTVPRFMHAGRVIPMMMEKPFWRRFFVDQASSACQLQSTVPPNPHALLAAVFQIPTRLI